MFFSVSLFYLINTLSTAVCGEINDCPKNWKWRVDDRAGAPFTGTHEWCGEPAPVRCGRKQHCKALSSNVKMSIAAIMKKPPSPTRVDPEGFAERDKEIKRLVDRELLKNACIFRCFGGSHFMCRTCVVDPTNSGGCYLPEKKQSPALIQQASEAAPFLGYQATVARSGALMVVSPILDNGKSWDDVKGDFTLTFTGHGYDKADALKYNVRWNGPGTITVTFPRGLIFTPQNEGRTQNLILAYKLEIELSSGRSKSGTMWAYCGNSNFGCSKNGLAMVVTKFKLNECHTWSQGAVWQNLSTANARTKMSRATGNFTAGNVGVVPVPTKEEIKEGNDIRVIAAETVAKHSRAGPWLGRLEWQLLEYGILLRERIAIFVVFLLFLWYLGLLAPLLHLAGGLAGGFISAKFIPSDKIFKQVKDDIKVKQHKSKYVIGTAVVCALAALNGTLMSVGGAAAGFIAGNRLWRTETTKREILKYLMDAGIDVEAFQEKLEEMEYTPEHTH